MSKYNNTKKYWLQLKESWFEEDAIKWIEEQPNGEKYSLFYLKLMCKAIKTNGFLIRQVGKMLIPYEPQGLADLTNTKDIDTVKVAMDLLRKIGLVEILEDGAIYIEQVQQMVISSSEGAQRKALQRAKKDNLFLEKTEGETKGWTEGGHLSTKDKDKDIIITKDIDITKDIINSGVPNGNHRVTAKDELNNIFITFCKDNNITEEVRNHIKLWLQYKSEKKQKYTKTGLTTLLKKLLKDYQGNGAEYVVNEITNSIENNYSGIFASKSNTINKPANNRDCFDNALKEIYEREKQ